MEWSADITKRRAAHVVTRLGDLLQHSDFAHKTLFISGRQPALGIKELISRLGLEGVEILWVEEKKKYGRGHFLLEAYHPSVAHAIFQEASREWEDNEGYFDAYLLQFGVFDSLLKGEILNVFLEEEWCNFWEMLNRPSAQSDEFIYKIVGELGESEITQEQETKELIYFGDKIPEEFKAIIEPGNPDCAKGAITWDITVSKRRAYAIISKLGDLLQSQEVPDKALYIHGTVIYDEYWFLETLRTTRGVEILWSERNKGPYAPPFSRKYLRFFLRLNSPSAAIIVFQALQHNSFNVGYGVFDHQRDDEILDSFYKGEVLDIFHTKDKVNIGDLTLHNVIAKPNHFVYITHGGQGIEAQGERVFCGEEAPSALREAVRLWP